VDVSTAYLEAAGSEHARRGTSDRFERVAGDFVALCPDLAPADIVTLDRVLCCYPAMEDLVAASAARARRLYGLVYPRSGGLFRLMGPAVNGLMRLRRSAYRAYVHDTATVDRLVRNLGFALDYRAATLVWQVFLYRRIRGS
jgi:magnesium-protoporphyrin O-methyltransferase